MQSNPYSSPINRESLERVPRRLSGLTILSGIVGCYGVGFGAFLILVGSYFGPSVLFAAAAHILFGFAFLASAVGLNANKTAAHWAIMALSLILVFASVLKVFASIADHDDGATILWAIVFAFFMAIAVCVLRCTLSLNGESTPADRHGRIAEQDAEPELPKTGF
jgi:hypothetical protein